MSQVVLAKDGYEDPTHAIIDSRGVAKSAAEKRARRLGRVAEARGFLWALIAATTADRADTAVPDGTRSPLDAPTQLEPLPNPNDEPTKN